MTQMKTSATRITKHISRSIINVAALVRSTPCAFRSVDVLTHILYSAPEARYNTYHGPVLLSVLSVVQLLWRRVLFRRLIRDLLFCLLKQIH